MLFVSILSLSCFQSMDRDSFCFLLPYLQGQSATISDVAGGPFFRAISSDHYARNAYLRVELDSFRLYCFHRSVFPFPVSPLLLSLH